MLHAVRCILSMVRDVRLCCMLRSSHVQCGMPYASYRLREAAAQVWHGPAVTHAGMAAAEGNPATCVHAHACAQPKPATRAHSGTKRTRTRTCKSNVRWARRSAVASATLCRYGWLSKNADVGRYVVTRRLSVLSVAGSVGHRKKEVTIFQSSCNQIIFEHVLTPP